MRTAVVVLAYLLALGLGLWQMHGPVFESRFARMQSEFGDGMLNNYILEHSLQCIANPEYCGTLSSPPCFFPQAHTLWYSEHLLGTAPVYWVLRLALPPDLAYQWWQLVFGVANFAAFALVLRWLKQPHILAILGGYLWAFGLVHFEQLRHQQMISRVWIPPAVYHAWMFALVLPCGSGTHTTCDVTDGTPRAPTTDPARHLNRMLGCVFLQSVTCVYTGWFLATGLMVFLPLALTLRPCGWAGLRHWLDKDRARARRAIGFWGLALIAAFVPYVVVNWGIVRDYRECFGYLPTPSAWFTGQHESRWDQTLTPYRSGVAEECRLFCGFGLYALMLAAAVYLLVVRRPDHPQMAPLMGAALLTAAIWGALTFASRDGGPSLWFYVRAIPGGGAIRCVSRVYVTVYVFGLIASLTWLGMVTANLRPWVRSTLLGIIAAIVIFEQTGAETLSYDKQDFYPIFERTAERLRGAEAAYVVPRYTDPAGTVHTGSAGEMLAMWAGLRANVPVVNGYSGRRPDAIYPWGKPADDAKLREWLAGKFHGKLTIVDPDDPNATRVIVIE